MTSASDKSASLDGPLFSVVVPAYNRVGLIARTLDSIAAQSRRDFELIVVDDGSSDGTPEAVESWCAGRPEIPSRVLRQANAGPGAARNTGIAHAVGEYIAFLDSDDIWPPWALETYAQVIPEASSPSLVLGSIAWFRGDPNLESLERDPLEYDLFDDFLSTRAQEVQVTGNFAARREALQAVHGFAPERMNGEDSDVYLRLGVEPGCVVIRKPLMVLAQRDSPGSSFASLALSVKGILHKVRFEQAGLYPGGRRRQRDRRRLIATYARAICMRAILQGDLVSGWRVFRRTLSWQIRNGRMRFCLGVPFFMARAALKSRLDRTLVPAARES